MRCFLKLAVLPLFPVLASCTSFDGRPTPVLSMNAAVKLVNDTYLPSTVIQTFNSKADSEKRAYRDEVIFVYMTAVDARYQNFLIGLSKQNKGTNLLLDAVVLGLTGGASFAGESTANALAAGAAFTSGTQGKINERLFYEKSLPALISMMEAERNAIKAIIIEKVGDNDATEYGMAEALADISDLQNAATIERAISLITEAAGVQASESNQVLRAARDTRTK